MARLTDLLLPPVLTRAFAFGRKAANAQPPAAGDSAGYFGAFAQFVGPQAADYPSARGFAAMARFGFGTNAYAYAAVLYVAESCAGIPWLLYDKRGGTRSGAAGSSGGRDGGQDRVEMAGHPLLTLLNARANIREGAARMWTRLNALMLLSGDAFLVAITPKSGPVTELYAVRPDRMTAELNRATGDIERWIYSVNGAKKQEYTPEVVRHLTEFNPEDDGTGLAPTKVASRAIDQHNSANDWNTALLQNMARPGGMLTPQGSGGQPVVVPQSSWEALKNDLIEKYTSPKNAGRPLVARMPMDWKDMATSPKDMDWLSGKTQAAREIAIAMRVPPELLGDAANKTYSNMQEARRGFYTERVLPRMDMLKSELNSWLLPLYGLDSERYELDYDTDDIEALQEDRQAVYDRAYKGWTTGLLTLDQALKMIGESEVGGELGGLRIIPSTYIPLTEAMSPAPAAEMPQQTTGPSDATAPQQQLPAPPSGNGPGNGGSEPTNGNGAQQQPPSKTLLEVKSLHANALLWIDKTLETEEQKAAHWRKTETSREAWYATVGDQVQAQFKTEHAAVVQAIRNATSADKALDAADAAIAGQSDHWTALVSAIHLSVGEAFAKETARDLEDEAKARRTGGVQRKALETVALVDAWQEHVVRWMLSHGAQKVKGITDTTRQRIQNELAQGVANEETIDQLAQRLDTFYLQSIIPNRSEVIARTETISASNSASLFAAQQTGLNLEKEWIATRDGRTRPDHAEADGQRVPLDQKFVVGGVEMDAPGTSGDPSQDIDCRCTQGYHVVE